MASSKSTRRSSKLAVSQWIIGRLASVPRRLVFMSLLAGVLAAIVPAVSVRAIQGLASNVDSRTSAIISLALVAAVFGFSSVLQQANYALARRVAMRVDAGAADVLNSALADSSASSFLRPDWMSELHSARECVSEGKVSTSLQGHINIAFAAVTAVSLVASLWWISPAGALISILAAAPALVTYGWYGKQESKLWPTTAACYRRAAYFDEHLAHPRHSIELIATGGAKVLAGGARESRAKGLSVRDRLENLSILSDTVAGFASSLCLLLALYLFWSSRDGQPVDLAAGVVGIVSGMSAMSGLGYQVGELATSVPAVRQFMDFLAKDARPRDGARASEEPGRQMRALEARSVTLQYPASSTPVVSALSVRMEAGAILAIVGGNGAGKTTLVRALAGILPPVSGECVLTFADRSTTSPSSATVAFLGQDFGRYELTVREYLNLGSCEEGTDEQLFDMLARVRLDEKIRELPNGLDTQLGSSWGGIDFSGGQWQKLAIARLFILNRPVWILDEPTSVIDAESEAEIFALLQRECSERCIIVVTHRVSTLTRMNDIVVMDNGAMVQRGSFDELRASHGRFREMFRAQLAEAEKLTGFAHDPSKSFE
ncbi:ABC transporter ATP-binding protein [Dermabacter hominis]|uniref:ABC transporter ATP-binding protein n=1 Tax=Dermabacter hominis TaxID=36740 RepID=UPI002A47545C|nr:ABC transporter ATP-binding protein/permease [Dermabacter hominis]